LSLARLSLPLSSAALTTSRLVGICGGHYKRDPPLQRQAPQAASLLNSDSQQLPSDGRWRIVLMVVLRRKWLALIRRNFIAAMNTTINPRVARDKPRRPLGVKVGVVDLMEVVRVLV
jgi:hypothetical protein